MNDLIIRRATEEEIPRKKIGTKLLNHAVLELFNRNIEIIYMEARDSTAKMVRAIGGRDTGTPFNFYLGNVTPMVLEKRAYMRDRNREGGFCR